MATSTQVIPALCLHHNDADGRACGAIVRKALSPAVRLYEIDYGEEIPWIYIQAAQQVIIVDFSLPPDDMLQIAQERKLVWIDHHVSAIEKLAGISASWAGVRDLSQAACVLTWRYFFPDHPIPRSIILIGDRDIWRMVEPDTRPFSEGLFQENTHAENNSLWDALLADDPALMQRLIERGQILFDARIAELRRSLRRNAYGVEFEGYRTLVINRPGQGEIFDIVTEMGYQVGYCYYDTAQNGKIYTNVMIGSRQVDVSLIASRFGGGGHKGAAGFRFERTGSPFPPGAKFTYLR